MYPIKTTPVYKQYIWGGENLKKLYNKDIPGYPTAESWEVGCHPHGMSLVANGEQKGMTVAEVIKKEGSKILGGNISADEKFPLLLKVLDAEGNLSVQVHPEDEYANIHENGEKGKTEMWYVLSAKEGASLVYGFKEKISTLLNTFTNSGILPVYEYIGFCKHIDSSLYLFLKLLLLLI